MAMRRKRLHTAFIAAAVLCLCLSWGVCGADEFPPAAETALLELINEAREAPLIMAAALGMDTDQILQYLPELKDILIEGLPPLYFNAKLYAAANEHSQDMLTNLYYSHDSLDGRTYDQRIAASGYEAVATGESLGVVGFLNYIEPVEAAEIIFKSMFKAELDPSRTEKRNILDPRLKDAGIALATGATSLWGSDWNVYIVTCDFGDSRLGDIESELLRLINEARAEPLQALEAAGISEVFARIIFGDNVWVLDEGLPPLAWNTRLYQAASDHNSDMIANNYFDTISPDGRGPADRVVSAGYEALRVGESLARVIAEPGVNPVEIAHALYEIMLKSEVYNVSALKKIFNPDMKDVGISVGTTPAGEEDEDRTCVAVADFAAPAETMPFSPHSAMIAY